MENKAISIVSLLSMIFGIVGVFISIGGVGILFDIPAIVLAVIALVKKFNNKGMAIAGLATGSAGIIIFILLIVATIMGENRRASINENSDTVEQIPIKVKNVEKEKETEKQEYFYLVGK